MVFYIACAAVFGLGCVDNLFIFVFALIMQGLFIAAGAVLISNFSGVFYLFGALLIYLGWQQVRRPPTVGQPCRAASA